MEVNFSAGEEGAVWIHGVPVSDVDTYEQVATYDHDNGQKFKVATVLIQGVAIKLVSECFS